MSSVNERERIPRLIRRLEAAYSKGLMSPEEYGTLRHQLELRVSAVKRPHKKKRGFQLKLVVIAVVAIIALVTIPFLLRATSTRPDFEVSTPKLENGILTLTITNVGSADAHLVAVDLLYAKGKLPIQVIEVLKTQDSISVTKKLNLNSTDIYGVQFNIVVSCREGVTKSIPFKG